MSLARRTRWSGVLVPALGPPVLLRGTTGSVVVPAPHDATVAAAADRVWDDGATRVWDDSADRTWDS